ncbi:MAG: T9SS type A sorting domain-containing protein [Saprospiraceae bacterium]|nr:T9SS type A sorting domain-containing protein [Saprospiraceae bacterium]
MRYSTANLDTLTENIYVVTGANLTWDFSHLEPTGQTVDHYKPSLQTPYAGFFFGLNRYGKLEADSIGFGQFQFKDVYRYYKNSASKFEIEGVGMKYSGFPIPSYYADADELYQFPLDYNDFDSSTFSYTLNLLTLGTLQTIGYRLNTVDGWGQVTTPYGTFNALRITTDVVSRDSIALGGLFGFGFDNHQREVKWFANGEGYPVMQVSGAVTNGQFNPNTVTYRDSFRVTPASPFAPTASFVADNVTPTTYDTVTITSNAFLSSHSWTFNPTTVTYVNGTSNSSRTPEVVFNMPGIYDVSLQVANNFGTDDTTTLAYINVTLGTNTSNFAETNDFKIFPNPTSDILNLEYNLSKTKDINISIHDLQGRQVALLKSETQNAGNQKAIFNLANYNLTKGVYLVKMSIDEETQWFKIVMQ